MVTVPPPPPAPQLNDVVVLKDGTRLEGTILKQEPGQYVTIQVTSGEERTLTWERVQEVIARPHSSAANGASSAAPLGPGMTTTTQMQANSSGASFSRTQDCTGGPDDPKCHKELDASMGAGGPRGSYRAEEDCAEHPESEICKNKTSVDVSRGGLSASYTQERVGRVKTPPSSAVNVALDLGAGTIVGGGGGATPFFFSASLKVKILAGETFPGKAGGSWNGVAIQPAVSGLLVIVPGDSDIGSSTTTLVGFQIGGTLGYQFMHFGKLDEKTLHQDGVGLLLGGYIGATGISVSDGSSGSDSSSSIQFSPSYGPEIGLSFPTYNAGTASYSAFNISLLVLPTGSTGTLLSASLGVLF